MLTGVIIGIIGTILAQFIFGVIMGYLEDIGRTPKWFIRFVDWLKEQ